MAGGERIATVEAWPVNVPLTTPYAFALGVYPGMSRTVVRVTTAGGAVGLGEGPGPEDAREVVALGEALTGLPLSHARDRLATLVPQAGPHPTYRLAPGPARAAAALDIALWDAEARAAELPLHALLGETVRTEIPFTEYFAPRLRPDGRLETGAELAAYCAHMAEEHAAPAFEGKVALGPLAAELAMVREVRTAIGPERTLRLDANTGWTLATAREALELLQPFHIDCVEEPVARFEELAELRRSSATRFSAHVPDLLRARALGVPDAFVLNLAACGGIVGTRRFVAACASAGVDFWFYSGDLGIATAAYLHVAAVTPHIARPSQSLLRWYADDVIAQGPFSPYGGRLRVPDGPGLGVDLDPAALRRATVRYARDGAYRIYHDPPRPRI